jgi:hypothetical protein
MRAIAEYHQHLCAGAAPGVSLDDRTWSDLDLDTVFASIDRTECTLGQQALYHRLRTAPVANQPDAFEALVNRLSTDAPLRGRMQRVLARLRNPYGYDLWWLAQPDAIRTRPWHVVFPIFTLVVIGCLLLSPVWGGLLLVPIFGGVLNLTMRITTARQMGPLIGPFRQVFALINAAETLGELRGEDVDPIVGCLHTDTLPLRRLKRIAFWVGRDALAAGDMMASIVEYLNLLFLLDVNAMYLGARELAAHGPALLRVIAAVGDVDAALSVAALRATLSESRWTRPHVLPPGAPATLTDLCHPLLEHPVPNSIGLAPPHGVLITGSNMSGKSTFLRTVGVNAVLAQTINTCFASRYDAPIFHIRSCIGRSDDLLAGKSYYIAEVEAVLALVRASARPEPHLFLFDELFRGTNAVERIAAAEAVLIELLADTGGPQLHIVLTATHDGELVDLLRETYASYHFTDTLGPDGLIFNHRLEPGPATTRNAIALLQLYGAAPTLIAHALTRAEALDIQRRPRRDPASPS